MGATKDLEWEKHRINNRLSRGTFLIFRGLAGPLFFQDCIPDDYKYSFSLYPLDIDKPSVKPV